MTNAPHDKVTKLFESQVRQETELKKVQVSKQDAVQAFDRSVHVKCLISTSQEDLAKVAAKNEHLFALAEKSSSPAAFKNH